MNHLRNTLTDFAIVIVVTGLTSVLIWWALFGRAVED